MAEQLDLAAAAGPTTVLWRIRAFEFERGVAEVAGLWQLDVNQSAIRVELVGQNGVRKRHEWVGPIADQRIVALNKANLNPPNTLNRRILQALIDDGIVAGALSGAPD